jgi:hypothetical protein
MYKIAYYVNSNTIEFKEFDTFKDAIDFSIKQPINSVIEIKHYDDKIENEFIIMKD